MFVLVMLFNYTTVLTDKQWWKSSN